MYFKCRHPLYEIVIDRPPEIVKAVFMDWPRYPLWNPFITSLSLLKGDIDPPSQVQCFTGLSVFKLMVTGKGFIAMNEALKKEAEAK